MMAGLVAMFQRVNRKVTAEHLECRTLQVDLPAPSSVDIEFNNITMTVSEGLRSKRTKTVLKGVSGVLRSGQLSAIMGPSGAGKSSLLNALTGFSIGGVTGTIRAGDSVCELGRERRSPYSLKSYRKKISYILQDDRLNPVFTVLELMKFATDIKLGNTLTKKLKLSVINEVLETLGLSGTENTRCGRLSGGQRKRLSIAVELIDNPPVVFLDEPTTGLDSSSSAQCIAMLKGLTLSGRTIVCTIHQPSASIYAIFDQVYVLSDGMCIYSGSSENTVPFLASVGLHCPKYHNPADYILEIATGEYGKLNELLAVECRQQDWTKKSEAPVPADKDEPSCLKATVAITPPRELYKFGILFKRCLMQQNRDWTVTYLKVLLHFAISVLLGLLFQHAGSDGSRTVNNLGYLLVSVAYLTYTSVMPAVLRFPDELPILKKENFNNWYNLKTYYAAIVLTGMPAQIWFSFVYSAPSYFLTGQPQELSRFLMFVLVLAHVTLLSDAIGNVIGTCVKPTNGTFFGAICTCAMILFAGFLVLLAHMNGVMRAVANVSFLKFAYEALMLSLYSYERQHLACPNDLYCHLKYPKQILKEFSMKPDNYWVDIGVLFTEIIIVRLIAYVTLKRKVNSV